MSARAGLCLWQSLLGAAALGATVGSAAVLPTQTLGLLTIVLSLFFVAAIALRLAAAGVALLAGSPAEEAPLEDHELPTYSVLIALYKEVEILPHLAEALRKLDYPAEKLDILLVLESCDGKTIAAAKRQRFPASVDIVIVPDFGPKTKPKALNYALQFAKGDLIAVFDAEDRPEPDQLRKAAARFAKAPERLVCLQARLDYYNARKNWLSRQFTLEYAGQFRAILPLLSRLGLPLPLGGTSNHFRARALRELGGWDPFNVTEDADFGLRLYRAGLRAETLNSTTYEEACSELGGWLRQRTRWLKGWMQTVAVHTREPARSVRECGFWGFWLVYTYFAGAILSALVHPLGYAVVAYQIFVGDLFSPAQSGMDAALSHLALLNFCGGYFGTVLLAFISLKGSPHRRCLGFFALLSPLYWLLMSLAAWRALFQLIRAPYYWDKTAHGKDGPPTGAGWPGQARP